MDRRKFVVASALILGSQAACYGGFNLTRKVHKWNGTMGNKWVNWVVFLGLTIIPVYALCLLADALVLNSVEFWSGSNPMRASAADGTPVMVARISERTLRITWGAEPPVDIELGRAHGELGVAGERRAHLEETPEGGIVLYGPDGRITHQFSPAQVEALMEAARRQEAAVVDDGFRTARL